MYILVSCLLLDAGASSDDPMGSDDEDSQLSMNVEKVASSNNKSKKGTSLMRTRTIT